MQTDLQNDIKKNVKSPSVTLESIAKIPLFYFFEPSITLVIKTETTGRIKWLKFLFFTTLALKKIIGTVAVLAEKQGEKLKNKQKMTENQEEIIKNKEEMTEKWEEMAKKWRETAEKRVQKNCRHTLAYPQTTGSYHCRFNGG